MISIYNNYYINIRNNKAHTHTHEKKPETCIFMNSNMSFTKKYFLLVLQL